MLLEVIGVVAAFGSGLEFAFEGFAGREGALSLAASEVMEAGLT